MRYTDEGNLRFSGNTRTSSPNQGYYRSELDSGKYAVTLTGLEPGLGYLGFNADELTYDIDNHTLCACNLELCGGICGDLNICGPIYADGLSYTIDNHTLCTCNLEICGEICGNLNVSGNITAGGYLCSCGELYVSDSIYGESDLNLSGGLCLGAPGDVCIYDKCGHDVFCSYNGDLCIYGLSYEDDAYTSNKSCIEMENDSIRIRRETNDGAFGISICNSDDLITFMGKPASEEIKFLNGNTISTTSSCLKLDNDVCVPAIFTIGSGSSTKCHYIHTVSLNNSTYTSTDGTIDLGNITAVVGLDGNGSFLVTNCTFSVQPTSSVVIGYNAITEQSGAIAIGCESCVNGENGIAIGVAAKAYYGGLAIGRQASACCCSSASIQIFKDIRYSGFRETTFCIADCATQNSVYYALNDMFCLNPASGCPGYGHDVWPAYGIKGCHGSFYGCVCSGTWGTTGCSFWYIDGLSFTDGCTATVGCNMFVTVIAPVKS